MKLSRYSKEIKLNEQEYILYNTLSGKYIYYSKVEKEEVNNFINNINRESYTAEEIRLCKDLMDKGIIIDEQIDELKTLEYLENKAWYQEKIYRLTIFATNTCNFRCSYCTQEHETSNLGDDVISKIYGVIEALSQKYEVLQITWFGGEPLLMYSKIKEIIEKAIKICEAKGCELVNNFVTNGYLLNEVRIEELRRLHTETMQITVDSCPEIHNKQRPLINGNGTYQEILNNIKLALASQINVVLRINIDADSYKYPLTILDDIPPKLRKNTTISVSNIFQNNERYSTYKILYRAIEMGYNYSERENDYSGCLTCGNRRMVIDTNGDILFCTNANSKTGVIGELKENGVITYKNRDKYMQMIMTSVRENEECQRCIELPFCIKRCRLERVQQNKRCYGKQNDGLSLEERAKLDFYYDWYNNKEKKE